MGQRKHYGTGTRAFRYSFWLTAVKHSYQHFCQCAGGEFHDAELRDPWRILKVKRFTLTASPLTGILGMQYTQHFILYSGSIGIVGDNGSNCNNAQF